MSLRIATHFVIWCISVTLACVTTLLFTIGDTAWVLRKFFPDSERGIIGVTMVTGTIVGCLLLMVGMAAAFERFEGAEQEARREQTMRWD